VDPRARQESGACRSQVVGAHLTGQPRNRELTDRGRGHSCAPPHRAVYRLYALGGAVRRASPGWMRVDG